MFTLYSADFINAPANCSYPHKHLITDTESLMQAVCHDYVCAEYLNDYRNNENFISSDCLALDCDNDHSENPLEWVNPKDIQDSFPDVTFAVHYSRYHMREKNGKIARPKFHVLFPIDTTTDADAYSEMKRLVQSVFPYFDHNALDSGRFFFGTHNAKVEIFPASLTLSDYFRFDEFDQTDTHKKTIPQGSRNATMSRFAGRILKRFGDTETAFQCFCDEAKHCDPPLENEELMTIWHSAKKFYSKISKQADYISPELYNAECSYKPNDFSDVGQAEVLAKYFSNELRYSPSTHYLRYNGRYWQETEPGAQAVAHELTRRQLNEALGELLSAEMLLKTTGAQDILDNTSKAKAEMLMNEEQTKAYQAYLSAKAYYNYVIQRRASKNITATLKEARPMLELSPQDLDSDPFLLCTPDGTYDLRLGMNGARAHSAEDYITKITTVSPSEKGKDIWMDCLNLIFCNDQALIDYVQLICGLAAIGKVKIEALIIAYGCGRNGKSTFWNSISRVLGLYSGNISADTLTFGCRRNVKPEMAEIKGKRLLIASEMQEGARLNDSTIKQLCSVDDIFAEKKYKDPFSFSPSHSLVLYTNHLPKVGASDDGTWRRLIVIPFNAKIEGKSDIKNFGDYLYQNAAESILAWIIEGAKKVIDSEYKFPVPPIVQKAIDDYRTQNDWFGNFLSEKCELDESFKENSNLLYRTYRNYCIDSNEYIRSTADFYLALENAGFKRILLNRKRYFKGLRLKNDDFNEDFI